MRADVYLLLAGASVRAAALSALRAGLRPWCVDLFADADLQARCPSRRLPARRYPEGLVEAFAEAPPGPWLYTGALENRPRLVERLSRNRPLWGNGAQVLRKVRSPLAVAAALRQAGIPCPAVRREPPRSGRWLIKPLAGAGGRGIALWDEALAGKVRPGGVYFQEYVEGPACAAVYLGDGERTEFLGATRQLAGEGWLHAAPFHYCGSLGPLPLAPSMEQAFRVLGRRLAETFSLGGLFGIDCIARGGAPLPVEVNPRYTASMELLEHARGVPLLALHRQVFDPSAAFASEPRPNAGVIGKAILFARKALLFPADGPWHTRAPSDNLWQLPVFADIPHPGMPIEAGRPVLTFFARATSIDACLDALRQKAAGLDRLLFP